MPEPDHSDFEVLIEKRLRGEETPDDRARLDAHLAECDQCQAILDEALQTIRSAHARLREAKASTNWPTLERHLNAEVAVLKSNARFHLAVAVLGPLATAAILACLAPILGWRWVAIAAAAEAILLGLIVLWFHLRSRARLRELTSGMSNTDALWSAELRRRKRAGRLHVIFVVTYFTLIAAAPLIYMPVWPILFFLFNPFLVLPLLSPELRRRRKLYERGLIDRKTYLSRQPIRSIGELAP